MDGAQASLAPLHSGRRTWSAAALHRVLAKNSREQKLEGVDQGFKALVERGYLEVARDVAGKPIYRRGQLAYKLSAKAAKMDQQALRDLIEGRSRDHGE
jgi:hypothetical protein